MSYLIHNSKILKASEISLSPGNRSFRFGDGLYESIRMIDGQIPFLADHLKRLSEGMGVLKLAAPEELDEAGINQMAFELAQRNEVTANAYIRLVVYRSGSGKYTPDSSASEFVMELTPLPSGRFELDEEGLSIGIYAANRKTTDRLSNFKTNNALPYILAGIHAQEKGWDDAILLNTDGRVAEATSSNVFLLEDDVVFTPPLTEGCIGGVMRLQVIKAAEQTDILIREREIFVDDFDEAEEVFLTNSIQGIRWVGRFGEKTYENEVAKELTAALNGLLATNPG